MYSVSSDLFQTRRKRLKETRPGKHSLVAHKVNFCQKWIRNPCRNIRFPVGVKVHRRSPRHLIRLRTRHTQALPQPWQKKAPRIELEEAPITSDEAIWIMMAVLKYIKCIRISELILILLKIQNKTNFNWSPWELARTQSYYSGNW